MIVRLCEWTAVQRRHQKCIPRRAATRPSQGCVKRRESEQWRWLVDWLISWWWWRCHWCCCEISIQVRHGVRKVFKKCAVTVLFSIAFQFLNISNWVLNLLLIRWISEWRRGCVWYWSSGSDQRRSHIDPSWGTSWTLSRVRIWSKLSKEGERPPWRQKTCIIVDYKIVFYLII